MIWRTVWNIIKIRAVWNEGPVPMDTVYDVTMQTIVALGTTDCGAPMYRIGDGEYSDELLAMKDAGTHTVYFMIVGDSDHSDSEEASFAVVVAQKEVKVSGILLIRKF